MWKIEKFIQQERLNILDEEFVIRIYKDIDGFLNEKSNNCVLIFPPLNNRRRYFIHRVGKLFNVQTFSIGEGVRRLTVVCASEINKKKVDEEKQVMDKIDSKKGAISKTKRTTRPDAPIYIPPAIRRVHQPQLPEKNDKTLSVIKENSRPKDSEKPVNYSETCNSVNNLSEILEKEEIQSVNYEPDSSKKQLVDVKENESIESILNVNNISQGDFIVPETNVITLLSLVKSQSSKFKEIDNSDNDLVISSERVPSSVDMAEIYVEINGILKQEINTDENVVNINIEVEVANEEENKKRLWANENKDNDQEQEELLRASEEINRRNKRIIKQSFSHNSDVLIISNDTKLDEEQITSDKPRSANSQQQQQQQQQQQKHVEPVDCWEDLFEGGQLESDLMLQIIDQVGIVDVTTAKEDYSEFKEKTSLDGDYAHILELYDFPKEFQTRDLVSILDSFKTGTYHIKWVDDNHALGVFSSGFIATDLMKLSHPLLKLRPMCEASKQSIAKALRYPNAMAPSATRPQTCPQTARRMVTGALGLKLTNAKEERAKEIKILKEAREKKKLSAKQQDDAWEGKPSSS